MIDKTWVESISFSDTNIIKVLIRYRSELDPYIYIEDRCYDISKMDIADDVRPLNQDLICLFADLDNLIKNTSLTDKQEEIIHLYEQGYSDEDIAIHYGQLEREIEYILDTICEKLKFTNDEAWKYDYVYMNYKKAKWSYKLCSKCKENKPMTEEFFRDHPITKDGFQSRCRECERK